VNLDVPDRQAQIVRALLAVVGIVLLVAGWLRWML
jgi:hypothetical protein